MGTSLQESLYFGGKRAVFPVNCPRNQIGHKKVLQGERY